MKRLFMKPFNLAWWQQWLLDWQERMDAAAQSSGWEDEDLAPPRPLERSSWSKEATAVLEELEDGMG